MVYILKARAKLFSTHISHLIILIKCFCTAASLLPTLVWNATMTTTCGSGQESRFSNQHGNLINTFQEQYIDSSHKCNEKEEEEIFKQAKVNKLKNKNNYYYRC